jgi:hypothetical protein
MSSNNPTADRRAFLRHTIATLAYRGGKAVANAPPEFAAFQAAPGSRTAGEILAHIGDLLDWALHIARGEQVYAESPSQPWAAEVARFFASLQALDSFLASDAPLECEVERLFQAPIADALTHVGQIALLRRLAGAPVRGENYFKAEIVMGRVGAEQSAKRHEFD